MPLGVEADEFHVLEIGVGLGVRTTPRHARHREQARTPRSERIRRCGARRPSASALRSGSSRPDRRRRVRASRPRRSAGPARWGAPGGGVGREDQAGMLQVGHHVADRGRRQAHRQDSREVARSHWFPGGEIALDDLAEDLPGALVEGGESLHRWTLGDDGTQVCHGLRSWAAIMSGLGARINPPLAPWNGAA